MGPRNKSGDDKWLEVWVNVLQPNIQRYNRAMDDKQDMPGFCRDCLAAATEGETRCRVCGSPRLVRHRELNDLAIAHIDCDAFYAAVEKRDNPDLKDKPVIIGGGTRGVVSTACYVARIKGVKSAMPMFKALALCPEATVIRPRYPQIFRCGHSASF